MATGKGSKTNQLHRTVVTRKPPAELAPGEYVVISTVDLQALWGFRSELVQLADALVGRNAEGHRYESMVFTCDEKGTPISWSDLDVARTNVLAEVEAQHKAMVAKWSAL